MEEPYLGGTLPVLATPFTRADAVDLPSLRRLADYAVAAGADGVVYPGVASEVDTLSGDERAGAFAALCEAVAGRVPVIVGASAPDAAEAARQARAGEECGASAAMVMAPARAGRDAGSLTRFFSDVAAGMPLPLVLQNAPPPVGAGLPVDTILEVVSAVPTIRYVKEETLPCGQRITALLHRAPAHLRGVFGGAGGRYIVGELSRGARGTMPAVELTEAHAAVVRAHLRDDMATARRIYYRILPLLGFQAVFRMRMTKAVLKLRGLIETERVRAPLPAMDEQDREELETMLAEVRDLLLDGPDFLAPS